jgi:hypothetical protein
VVAWVVGMRVEEVEGKAFEGSLSRKGQAIKSQRRGARWLLLAGVLIGRRWIRRKRPGV